jgi:hypothetical protein
MVVKEVIHQILDVSAELIERNQMQRVLVRMAYSLVGLIDCQIGARLVTLLVYASLLETLMPMLTVLGMGMLSSQVVLDSLLFDLSKRSLLFVVRIRKTRRRLFVLNMHPPLAELC